jgi:hypothetical protein
MSYFPQPGAQFCPPRVSIQPLIRRQKRLTCDIFGFTRIQSEQTTAHKNLLLVLFNKLGKCTSLAIAKTVYQACLFVLSGVISQKKSLSCISRTK